MCCRVARIVEFWFLFCVPNCSATDSLVSSIVVSLLFGIHGNNDVLMIIQSKNDAMMPNSMPLKW
uniref:Secreted protein n=1 Tax=Arundo donax TaxID=35708 RepID=A0A0A8YXG3_ARUDO